MQQLKKSRADISLSPRWQLLFIIAIVFSYLTSVGFNLLNFPSTYLLSSERIFQLTQWLLPVVFLALALWFFWARYKAWLERLFMAFLTASIAQVVFQAVVSGEQEIRYFFSLYSPLSNDWIVMILGVLVFAGILVGVKLKERQK